MDAISLLLIVVGGLIMLGAVGMLVMHLRRLRVQGGAAVNGSIVQRGEPAMPLKSALTHYVLVDFVGAALVTWGLLRHFL